jgi:hypothetical protein
MSGNEDDFTHYEHTHELLPMWARFLGKVLTPKPTDSAGLKALRVGGTVVGAPLAASVTLGAHALDEIRFGFPFAKIPGVLEHKAYRAIVGPPRDVLHSRDTFTEPLHHTSFKTTTIPKTTVPSVMSLPRKSIPTPHIGGFANALHVNANLFNHPTSPMVSAAPKLTMPKLGTSLPFRPIASGLSLGTPRLTLGQTRSYTPAPASNLGSTTRGIGGNLHVADPSWALKLNKDLFKDFAKPTSFGPSIASKLTEPKLGSSLPFRPMTANIGLGLPHLTMGKM